jgi:hypothetical protein
LIDKPNLNKNPFKILHTKGKESVKSREGGGEGGSMKRKIDSYSGE